MSSNIITHQEFEYLVVVAQWHFQFMYDVAHGLSYLLDPRPIGDGLPTDSRNNLEEVLILYIQFMAYFISATKERQANFFRYQMLSKGSKIVLHTGRPMDVGEQICKASRSVSLVWRRLMWHPNETSQWWASSIPS
jgi:hypothetical protein